VAAAGRGVGSTGWLAERYCSRTQEEPAGDDPVTQTQPGQSGRACSIVMTVPSGQPIVPTRSSQTDRIRTPSPSVFAM